MDVLWGIIILIVMYIVVPVAIIGGTLFALGGGERLLPAALRPRSRVRPLDERPRAAGTELRSGGPTATEQRQPGAGQRG